MSKGALRVHTHTLNRCEIWRGYVSYVFGSDQVFDGCNLMWSPEAVSDATGWTFNRRN